MQLRRWIIAVVVALVGFGAPLCSLACTPDAAPRSAHHDMAGDPGAPCHDTAPASESPSDPSPDRGGCGDHCDARTLASAADLGVERPAGQALAFAPPWQAASVVRAQLPSARAVPGVAPPGARSVLLRKSTLLL